MQMRCVSIKWLEEMTLFLSVEGGISDVPLYGCNQMSNVIISRRLSVLVVATSHVGMGYGKNGETASALTAVT